MSVAGDAVWAEGGGWKFDAALERAKAASRRHRADSGLRNRGRDRLIAVAIDDMFADEVGREFTAYLAHPSQGTP